MGHTLGQLQTLWRLLLCTFTNCLLIVSTMLKLGLIVPYYHLMVIVKFCLFLLQSCDWSFKCLCSFTFLPGQIILIWLWMRIFPMFSFLLNFKLYMVFSIHKLKRKFRNFFRTCHYLMLMTFSFGSIKHFLQRFRCF